MSLAHAAAANTTNDPAPALTVTNALARFEQARARGLAPEGVLLLVSVPDQRLAVIQADGLRASYRVSTSLWGVGARQDSQQTPAGWHRVAEWIGADARPGQSFVARRPTAEVLSPENWRAEAGEDYVLTRILWLEGLEPGLNRGPGVDSYDRFIYLHGTNQEQLLGQPASHGCVRLSNRDILEVFDLTQGRQTYCWIVEEPLL